jgi:arginyl-tRNA synthetase
METIQQYLEARVRAAVGESGGVEVSVQSAHDPRFGDYQTNVAMQLVKVRGGNPRAIAQELIGKIDLGGLCEKPEIAGAGFINFRVKPEGVISHFLQLAKDTRLGTPSPVKPRTIVIDFSSPNVAKPMHVGHIRSTILGDALARTARFVGHRVVTDNHIGDWGKQFGMLLIGWKRELDRAALEKDPIGEMERLYKKVNAECEADSAAADAARAEVVKLQSGDAENLAIWKEMIRLSQVQFDEVYARLGITFDHVYGESFYNPWLRETVAELTAKGLARESEGAICVFSDGSLPEKDDPFLIKGKEGWQPAPAMVQKTDGAANYTTTDLATLAFRQREFAPDEILYVTDGRQQLHFRQLFLIWKWWRPDSTMKLAHVWFGKILGDDGKPFKTRSGDTPKLADLLSEAEERALAVVTEKNPELPDVERREIARIIGLGAIKYADLLSNRQSDYVFSWDRMLSFQGNTAPYLQNAYVRVRAIFRKAAEQGIALDAAQTISFSETAELTLVKKIAQFGEMVPTVLEDYRPNLLCNYLYELAGAFHSFFEACPVLKAEEPVRSSRLMLCEVTGRVLKQGLGLLGIEAPERM